jgi:cytochrome c553
MLAIQVCATCHGSGGHSISPTFPRLAGQTAQYIAAQLNAFKDQTRKDPDAQAFMWGMAAQLDQATIEGLGRYYAAQKPQAAKPQDPELVAAGRRIYAEGLPADGVPPCASCHGKDGQGVNEFPRLAGQHVAYQVKQLKALRSGLRASPIMQPIAARLREADMRAVATFMRSK